MKYDSPELIDKLAAEYVLGTLHGKARARFERLSLSDFQIRNRIAYWESQLLPLHEDVQPIMPSAAVWKNILQRISTVRSEKTSFWDQVGTWRAMSFAMSLMFAVVVVSFQFKPMTTDAFPVAQYVTVLATKDSQAAWIVRMYTDSGKITAQALKTTEPGLKKAYELWMLPGDGASPQSVGLMPASGEKELALSDPLMNVLLNTNSMAVSLEPEGGSPTGLPTGPVLYTGKLNSI